MYFLLRMPNKQPATRNLLVFLSGATLVFFAFFYIFSSLDHKHTQIAWWLLHAVVFSILFLVQFAYHYPRTLFVSEARLAFRLSLILSVAVYLFYIIHTTQLQPVFDANGGLFVYLETHEIGILVALELLWVLAVLARQTNQLRQLATNESADTRLRSAQQIAAIKKLSLVLLSPVGLVALIILAYMKLADWGVVAHMLGSGLMIFVLIFTVIYLNNSTEPSTLQVKLVGISLGTVLIVLGLSSTITLGLYHDAHLGLKQHELEHSILQISRGEGMAIPERVAYIKRQDEILLDKTEGTIASDNVHKRPWQENWDFLQAADNDVSHYYIAYTEVYGDSPYEIGYRYLDYRAYIHEMAKPLLYITLAAAFLVIIVFPMFFRLSLFVPLQRLLAGVGDIERGKLDTTLPISVHDEIGILTHSFNTMADSVKRAQQKLHAAYNRQLDLTEAYSRFVPKEILTTLNKQSILELGLGDNVHKKMTILFSDIRSFTTISESMTPEEIFRFINSYLQGVGPIIRQHGGYIDKYIGDAVMALFPSGPDEALAAAIAMQSQARQFNSDSIPQGVATNEIRIGVGIHTGELMLGTIGEPQRMEGTVISDAVNLASRIEGLTKLYNAPILISLASYENLSHPQQFHTRRLDRVRVKGKQQWVEIIEVLDGAGEQERHNKLAQMEQFDMAVTLFQQEKFSQSLELFKQISCHCPEDAAVDVYIERCEQFIELGIPDGWDGASRM